MRQAWAPPHDPKWSPPPLWVGWVEVGGRPVGGRPVGACATVGARLVRGYAKQNDETVLVPEMFAFFAPKNKTIPTMRLSVPRVAIFNNVVRVCTGQLDR